MKQLLTLALTLLLTLSLRAQTQDEIMAKVMAANIVGQEHDILKQMVGNWAEETSYNLDPSQPPMKVIGTSTIKMILGGRFAQLEGTASMMGEASERMSIIGHDNRRGVYTINAFDTHGTYGISAEGKYDPATKTITFVGVEDDPLMPPPMDFRILMRYPDANTIEMEIWFLMDFEGKPSENKVVSMIAKRVLGKVKTKKKAKL